MTIAKDPGTLEVVFDQSQNQEICNKAVEDKPRVLKFVPHQYRSRVICEKNPDGIPYSFATPLILEKSEGCCDKYEEEF